LQANIYLLIFWSFYALIINWIAIEIIKPTSPIANIPIAETFATIENSSLLGFLNNFQTLTHFLKKIDDFSITKIKLEAI
jgi:hypothetical protein